MQQWTQEQAIAYEAARECITALIGVYMSDLYEEEARDVPRLEVVAQLHERVGQVWRERTALKVTDDAAVQKVRSTYGPQVRAAMDAARAANPERLES